MRMYCIVSREALKAMNGNRGKLAAQAGHAYLHAYWDAETKGWFKASLYRDSDQAKKVCLVVETTDKLRELETHYRSVCGVSLVTDAGLTCFDGPTVTCLGIGPIRDGDIGEDIKSLKVLI